MNREEQKYIPICEYCKKPYKEYYKKELSYNMGFDSNEDCYEIKLAYKPACKCDFLHLSEEEKDKLINFNLFNSGLTPKLINKSFDNLELTEEQKRCKEYAENFIQKDIKGIKLIGNIGTGKTIALACMCRYLIENGYKCYFTTLSSLLGKYSKYSFDNAGDITGKLEKLNNFDLIILDDIGRETFTDRKKEITFCVIDYLINNEIKLVFSCNKNMFDKLKKLPELEAVIDRFNELCPNVIYFKGDSFRGKN